jgi:hypothetical protein
MQHTKLKRLVRALKVPQYAAVGILESLWHLTAREAPEGNIGKLSNEDIAIWIDWDGDSDALIYALVASGWIDEDEYQRLMIHDWQEHADDATKKAMDRQKRKVADNGGNVQTRPDKTRLPEPLPVPVPKPVKKVQKPSRSGEVDSRHVPFKLAVQTYMLHKGATFVWDGSEAKAMDLLLKATPGLNLGMFQACLNNRARSPGTPHGERPRLWLPNVTRYQNEPLNEFGKTGVVNGTFKGKTESSLDAAKRVIEALENRDAANGFGYPQAGEIDRPGLPSVCE